MTRANTATVPDATSRVSTFELFFDLVFVLTIVRVGAVLHGEPDLLGLAAMFLILANIWWMYAGYAWLTSRVDATGLVRRLVLFVGMGGFLVMALAAPEALGGDGLLFGIANLVVLVVYLGLFRKAFPRSASRTFWQVAPWNLASAGLLIVAGFVEGAADWWLWTGAAALHVVQQEFRRVGDFPLFGDVPSQPARYVERHGVVLIVALSESMLALGLGVGDRAVTPSIVVAGLLTLALAAAMWALYFVDTDEAVRRALEAAPTEHVIRIAVRAFNTASYRSSAGF
jgi:low temperature requirement protein LtrA